MKIHAMTMSYNKSELIDEALNSFYVTCGEDPETHVLLDQHYPLPSVKSHMAHTEMTASNYKILYLDARKNVGYHEGINLVAKTLPDEDILINYDPDAMVKHTGWLPKIREAFESDPDLVVVGLNNECIDRELIERGHHDRFLESGLVLRYTHKAVVMSIIAWKVGFIREVGGLTEPFEFYGGIEAWMWPKIVERGKKWAILRDYWEDNSLWFQADPLYNEWKKAHADFNGFKGDFEAYLKEKGVT